MNRYNELLKQKSSTELKLKEINEELKQFENTIIKGKIEKIITLMYELSPYYKNTLIYNLFTSDIDTDELYSINLYELTQILENFLKTFQKPIDK